MRNVNRWAGFGIGTNNLLHLQANLEILTRGKSENVGQFFDVKKLRKIVNPTLRPSPILDKTKKLPHEAVVEAE